MAATRTTTIRLTPAAKRRLAAAARRRGVSTHKFILDAALDRANAVPDADRLDRLAAIVEQVREAVEDELDARIGDAAWERHLASGAKRLNPEEAWRDLGI
jgi:uncharacterized protein (DUF1778 family)